MYSALDGRQPLAVPDRLTDHPGEAVGRIVVEQKELHVVAVERGQVAQVRPERGDAARGEGFEHAGGQQLHPREQRTSQYRRDRRLGHGGDHVPERNGWRHLDTVIPHPAGHVGGGRLVVGVRGAGPPASAHADASDRRLGVGRGPDEAGHLAPAPPVRADVLQLVRQCPRGREVAGEPVDVRHSEVAEELGPVGEAFVHARLQDQIAEVGIQLVPGLDGVGTRVVVRAGGDVRAPVAVGIDDDAPLPRHGLAEFTLPGREELPALEDEDQVGGPADVVHERQVAVHCAVQARQLA
ncbi:hypothetical protein F6456_09260 [Streptomyces sp. LBUM 1484]|nr:hypothetical protein [Streptomyces sp. LBUM 1484]